MARKGSDTDRRLRQCERLGRALKLLGLIQSKGGPWNAQVLARELEVSERTVYRDLQILSAAGVPWFFDESCGGYKVRSGFRTPIRPGEPRATPEALTDFSLDTARRIIADAERLVDAIEKLKATLGLTDGRSG